MLADAPASALPGFARVEGDDAADDDGGGFDDLLRRSTPCSRTLRRLHFPASRGRGLDDAADDDGGGFCFFSFSSPLRTTACGSYMRPPAFSRARYCILLFASDSFAASHTLPGDSTTEKRVIRRRLYIVIVKSKGASLTVHNA